MLSNLAVLQKQHIYHLGERKWLQTDICSPSNFPTHHRMVNFLIVCGFGNIEIFYIGVQGEKVEHL
jgi:hypothetical protein